MYNDWGVKGSVYRGFTVWAVTVGMSGGGEGLAGLYLNVSKSTSELVPGYCLLQSTLQLRERDRPLSA